MKLHTTLQSDTFYVGFIELPPNVQATLRETLPELENSRYTVFEYMAFIRCDVSIDGMDYDAEISLGSCDVRGGDFTYNSVEGCYIDIDGMAVDERLYAHQFMQDLVDCVDLEGLDVYLTRK